MSRYGPLVIFKSTNEMYAVEYNGNKPNTVRIMDRHSTRLDTVRAHLVFGESATIEICRVDGTDPFFRSLTDISQVGSLLGKDIWVLSWRHEDGPGDYCEDGEAE